jgi:anthraniloyl-CoA monooxygenase
VAIARELRTHGCDIVDVSAGNTVPDQEPDHGRLFQTPFSDLIRNGAGIPTMTVGGVSSYADVNSILAAGRADLCVLARAHLYDPYWTRHAAHEQGVDLPWPNQYVSAATFRPRAR